MNVTPLPFSLGTCTITTRPLSPPERTISLLKRFVSRMSRNRKRDCLPVRSLSPRKTFGVASKADL